MKRTLEPLQLSKSPLVLVLCQVRVAAVQAMEDYVPRVQDRLRREGFPIDVSGHVQEFSVQGGQAVARKRPHWEFRTKDERWSVIVGQSALVLQTTDYSSFDAFLARMVPAFGVVNEVVGDLVIERIGLRYVDLIRPAAGESWKDYVQPGLHGLESELVAPDRSLVFTQITTQTGDRQRLIARLAQNREGIVLPPDLAAHPPAMSIERTDDELITLLDLDHYREVRTEYSAEAMSRTAWELHDGLDALFRSTVTRHALEAWR